jgi:hypothetical protein
MLESMMYIGIGFLFAALIAVGVVSLVHNRAVRLTTRRMEAALPPSITEVQAEKDLQRAEFAMSTRRLEMTVEQLNEKYTNELTELARTRDALARVEKERNAQQAEIIALKIQLDALNEPRGRAGREMKHHDGMGSFVSASFSRAAPLNDQHIDVSGLDIGEVRPGHDASAGERTGNLSIGRRAFRAVARFCVALAFGVGAAVAAHYHSDDIKATITTLASSLTRLPSATTAASTTATQPTPVSVATVNVPEVVQEPSAVPAKEVQPTAAPEPPPAKQEPPPAAPEQPPIARQEQPAAKQEPVARAVAAPRAIEREVRPSAPPQPPARLTTPYPETRPTTPYPETRPTTIPGWRLRDVVNGVAVLEGPPGVIRAGRGDTVPGVGRVESIVRWGGRWLVATSSGLISTP